MQLKRDYVVDEATGELTSTVRQIRVLRHTTNQKFSQRFIDKGVQEGFITISKGKIILHTIPELTYKVNTVPGLYCCHDGAPLDDEKSARSYVAEKFKGVESPDANNPSGYRKDTFYSCTLVEGV